MRLRVFFYKNSPETRGKLCFSSKLWAAATVTSLIDFSLNLWNDRCDTMHGIDEEDAKRIIKKKITERVVDLYGRREDIETDYGYLFKETIDSISKRST